MPDNDIYELNVDAVFYSQNVCNTFHFRQVGSDGTGDGRTACMDMFVEDYLTLMTNCIVSGYQTSQLRCRRIEPTETQSLIQAEVLGGAIMGQGLPPQSCMILRQHAVPLLRRGTGHTKICGVSITAAALGRLDAAQLALNDLFGAAMIVSQTDSGSGFTFQMGVFSQVDQICRDIVATYSTPRVKTVYSRQVGVGG